MPALFDSMEIQKDFISLFFVVFCFLCFFFISACSSFQCFRNVESVYGNIHVENNVKNYRIDNGIMKGSAILHCIYITDKIRNPVLVVCYNTRTGFL